MITRSNPFRKALGLGRVMDQLPLTYSLSLPLC